MSRDPLRRIADAARSYIDNRHSSPHGYFAELVRAVRALDRPGGRGRCLLCDGPRPAGDRRICEACVARRMKA